MAIEKISSKKSKTRSSWRRQLNKSIFYLRKFFYPVSPSSQTGMGAIPQNGKTSFRVWAPNAERVFVVGSFNDWADWKTPLAPEGQGYWSADISQTKPGDEYKYLIHNNGQVLIRTDPYAREVTGGQSNSVIYDDSFSWPEEAHPLPSLNELIIYELHVGTFYRPNRIHRNGANGNGAHHQTEAETIGQFQDVIAKLPYLKSLGVNAIEIMPVKAFDGLYSWGYNPAHPFAVTRAYGGRTALKELVKAAHEHGLAVIIDVVYNHFGPQDLSLWQFDGWHKDGKGGIYFYNDWRSQTPWGDTRPDYGRDEVRQFLFDNAMMWFDVFQVDGLRWDATSYIRNAHGHDGDPGANIQEGWTLMQWINDEIQARYPGKINIAEDMQNNVWITKATQDDGAGFQAQWDAKFAHTLRQTLINPQDEDRNLEVLGDIIADGNGDHPWTRVIFTESHDEVANGQARIPEEIAPGEANDFFAKKRSTLGAAILFTVPGIPMIFQGQEFLESGWFDDHHLLDWGKAETNKGILKLYHDLISLRRNEAGYSRGLLGDCINIYHVNNHDKLLAFHRWHEGGPGDDVIVVANFANRHYPGYTIGLPHPGLWQVRFNSDEQVYDPSFGEHCCPDVLAANMPPSYAPVDGLPCWGNITIAPYSVLILSQS